ncbi:MAG: PQQ-binding-like beta-propeller repeat protein [Acidobacteriota bacterium]
MDQQLRFNDRSPRLLTPWACLLAAAALAAPSFGSAESSSTDERRRGEQNAEASTLQIPALPEGLASFGAAVAGDGLYVYGGHIGRTHQHSVDNLSHHFRSVDLKNPSAGWQDLGPVQGLQGTALVAHGGEKVCRIGGLNALNPQGEDADLVSVATASCYHIPEQKWVDLPALNAGRSSHDAVVLGDKIYVVGGWDLRGKDEEAVWHDTGEVLDLSAESPVWETFPQPFKRRALASAAAGEKIFAFGGLGSEGTSQRVDVYNPATGEWTLGPELPATEGLKGFGVSAFGIGEMILLSGGDGAVHAHRVGMDSWLAKVGQLEKPRFFHRLLPYEQQILFIGGANRDEGHLGHVETMTMAELRRGSRRAAIEAAGPQPGAEARLVVDRGTWSGFRGADGGGHSTAEDLPTSWSAESGVAWRAAIPGYGQSVPVVWGSQVFITSVEGPKKETILLSSYDLESGEVLWRRRFDASLHIENSDMYSRGAPTPVVDAERLYVFWESGDLMAFDHQGETLWKQSLADEYGAFVGNHGIGSSPVLIDDAVWIQVTHQGPSYYAAYDRADGSLRYKVDRDPGTAWTTPLVVGSGADQQVVISASGRVEAVSASTGEQLWQYSGLERNNVPSAVLLEDGRVLVSSSSPSHNILLKAGEGELDASSVLWTAEGVTSGFGSPIVHGECALIANRKGVVSCVSLESGERLWQHRLPGAVWASPFAVGDRIYYFTEKGEAVVLSHQGTSEPEVVAHNKLDTTSRVYGVSAVHGAILVRTGPELIRLGVDAELAADGSAQEKAEIAADGAASSETSGDGAAQASSASR